MNKRHNLSRILVLSSCFSVLVYGQTGRVGINTTDPKATLDITAKTFNGSQAEGLIAPRLTGDQIKAGDSYYLAASTGAIIYATAAVTIPSIKTSAITSPGYYYYDGTTWKPLGSTVNNSVVLDCNANGFSGNYINGIALTSSNRFALNITNNTFSDANITFQTSDLVLSGVPGITVSSVSIPSVILNPGQSQLIEYILSGTPASSGTLVGSWTKQTLNCVRTISITQQAITSLDCLGIVHNGSLTQGTAASGVSSVITYSGGDGSTYSGQAISSTGVTGLTATLAAGNFATGAGSLIFNITGTPSGNGTASFAINIGGQSCTFTRNIALPDAVLSSAPNCSGATNNGTLTSGTAANGVSSVISYTGGNGGTYSSQTVNSAGVTGLTATLTAGTLANGSGSLTYTITGTPSGAGTASFAINIGGQSCTFTRTVDSSVVTIPNTITLAQDRKYMAASIYDQDYLPYTSPMGTANTSTQAANGVNEQIPVNVQGAISTTGVTVTIPVTTTGNGTLPAYSQTITIPASMTEDGISRDLIFSWVSQPYSSYTKFIVATIKALGGTLNLKKLDINAGIGNDVQGILIGQFTYPYNNSGNISTYQVRDIAGIPDRMYGIADNTGDITSHMMLYVPVLAEDGKIWLNNNLGAHYSNINHPSFNPAQQATGVADYLAYGSKFQWGRKSDGHELITWTSGTSGTPVNGTTNTLNDFPSDVLFILPPGQPVDWRVSKDDTLWSAESSANNPCPVGFRVPTRAEQNTLFSSTTGITNSTMAAIYSSLKITSSGFRSNSNGGILDNIQEGHYWNSSVSGIWAQSHLLDTPFIVDQISYRASGLSVRCIKD